MKLIVLAGLVFIEKIQLVLELSHYFTASGLKVTIVDNMAGIRIDPVHLSGEPLLRLEGNILPQLSTLLQRLDSEVVLLAVSESADPDDLFPALNELPTDVGVLTLALIDVRTCDCFPHLRAAFEEHADIVVNLPYQFTEVKSEIERMSRTRSP